MNLTKLSDNVTTTATPSGVSIPQITKRDAVVFSNLLMKCRSLDVGRKIQQHQKLDRSEIDIIFAFCQQAIEDVHRIERDEHPEGFTPKKEVTA